EPLDGSGSSVGDAGREGDRADMHPYRVLKNPYAGPSGNEVEVAIIDRCSEGLAVKPPLEHVRRTQLVDHRARHHAPPSCPLAGSWLAPYRRGTTRHRMRRDRSSAWQIRPLHLTKPVAVLG